MWEKLYQKYNFKTNKPCVNSPLKDFLIPPLYYLLYYFLLLIFFCEFLNLCQFFFISGQHRHRKELNNTIGCNRLQAKICYRLQDAITGFRLLLQASGCYYSLQATGYRLQATGYRLQPTSYRLQGITVYRLQDTGYYSVQATGYRPKATIFSIPRTNALYVLQMCPPPLDLVF